MTLTEAFDAYARDVILFRNQSRKTEENHFIAMRSLVAFAGDIEIGELTFAHVRNWKQHLDRSRSTETVRNYIIKVRVVLAYLQQSGHDVLNPDRIPVPKRTDKVPNFLHKDDVAKLIEIALKPAAGYAALNRQRNAALVSFMYASGTRISECLSLNRDSIREDGSFSIVGKGGKARLCFTDERTKALLMCYLATRSDNLTPLFLSHQTSRRMTPGNVQEVFRLLSRKSGIKVHPHTLRHSFATNLLETNTNLFHVSKMLGHAQLTTTQQYLHVIDHDLKKVYEAHHTT
jgi:integrase/recombinase XerC